MMSLGWVVLIVGLCFVLAAWGLVKQFSVWNSKDGERYRKMRMQGPFVPLSKEDNEEDARRT